MMMHAISVESNEMQFTYKMPDDVRGVRYVANHHYVELEDKQGRKSKMPATAVLKCVCIGEHCGAVFFVSSNMGSLNCPHCGGPTTKIWGKMQIGFIPEDESDFQTGMTSDLPDFGDEEVTKDEMPADPSEGD
jgi:hypothetical protein